MTALEKFQAERSRISEALNMAGVAETLYNKDNIPKVLPCAILISFSVTRLLSYGFYVEPVATVLKSYPLYMIRRLKIL